MTEDEIVRWHHRCDRHEFEENLDTETGKNKEAKEHQELPASPGSWKREGEFFPGPLIGSMALLTP